MKKSELWFSENVKENGDDLEKIGQLAQRVIFERTSIDTGSTELTLAIYAVIFDSITDYIASKESTDSEYQVSIANRLEIGYTTSDDDEDEKVGNFMAYIRQLTNNKADITPDEDETDTVVLCTQWNAANITSDNNDIREIEKLAIANLDKILELKVQSSEAIIPMFCIIHDQIVAYLKLKRVEEGKESYEMNMAGLYTAGIQVTGDAEEDIYYIPSISLKLKFKNDAIASGSNE